jgi:outer membrane protein assembly factor BamB
MNRFCGARAGLILAALPVAPWAAEAADQAQWGQAWSRNMVSAERGLPARFHPGTGENIAWSAQLGTETHSSPVIAGGRVFIGTNNGHPRDPARQGDRGVLMCFDEASGRFLWQLVIPKREDDSRADWPNSGISSSATVEGNRVYLVSNRGEALCLDACDGRILWRFDLTRGAGISSHDAACSSILIHGDYLCLNTGTGVDYAHKRIPAPDAPSLVVLDKATGRYLAREREGIGPNIFHCTWAGPSLGVVNGRPLLFLAAGNGVVYAFEPPASGLIESAPALPASLKKVWQCDFDPGAPKTNVHKFYGNRRESPSNFYGMPVFDTGRLYVAGGGDLWWGKNEAWLKCLDAAKTGDVTAGGLVWSYPLQKHVLSTPAAYHGLIFIADCGRLLHCVDAGDGNGVWTHELDGEAWASPLVADGKVYLGTRRGTFFILEAAREKKVLGAVDLGSPVSATAAAANGRVYVASMSRLYALSTQGR